MTTKEQKHVFMEALHGVLDPVRKALREEMRREVDDQIRYHLQRVREDLLETDVYQAVKRAVRDRVEVEVSVRLKP